jgi:hypothetical protein
MMCAKTKCVQKGEPGKDEQNSPICFNNNQSFMYWTIRGEGSNDIKK